MVHEDVKQFSLENTHTDAYVCSVYDGDTITAIFPFPGTDTNYKWKCRLDRIDTPELRTKDDKEKQKATEVRDILRCKLLDKKIKLKCGKMDKYGRVLVDIFLEDVCINDWLVDEKLAHRYDGGTKKSWEF